MPRRTSVSRPRARYLAVVSLASAAAALSGCSHYYLPANRLESPEARGGDRLGRLEAVGVQSGVDLVASPTQVTPPADPQTGKQDPAYLQMQASMGNPLFGFSYAASDQVDLGLRFEPYAPLQLRGKYQFSGKPESKADRGNLSIAAVGGAGFTFGSSGSSSGQSVTYFAGDAAIIAGYRLWSRHLFSLGPFFAFGSLSGTGPGAAGGSSGSGSGGGAGAGGGSTSASGLTPPSATGVSATQYGAALGYQYMAEQFFVRGEVAYTLGAVGSAKISEIDPALMIGLGL